MTEHKWVEFNLNYYMAVRLTDEGLETLERIHNEKYGHILPFTPPKLVDGWWTDQAWSILEAFGFDIHIGFGGPIETTVRLELVT